MKPNELMIPRYKVIADYPDCRFDIGAIVTPIKDGSHIYECVESHTSKLVQFPEKYPHIFKPLEWWEEREEKDMPEYVTWRSCNSGRKYVAKILEIKDDKFRWKEGWETFTKDQDFPATKEEYENAAPL